MQTKTTMDIDRKTASKLLGVSVRTIDRYIRRGMLSASMKGGRVLLDKKEVLGIPDYEQEDSVPVQFRSRGIDSRHDMSTPNTDDMFRHLYDEAKRKLTEYEGHLQQANYRIGLLESRDQSINTVHPTQMNNGFHTDMIRRDILDKDAEIRTLKSEIQQERSSRFIFSVLTYILLAMLPVVWYLSR